MKTEKTCAFCGQTGVSLYAVDNEDGQTVHACAECIERELSLIQCENCGEWIPEDTAYGTEDGYVCESCFCDEYTICDDCGDAVRIDSCHTVRNWRGDERYVCDYCARDYHRCADCGDLIDDSAVALNDGDTVVCNNCDGYWCTCYECGAVIHRDNAEYDEDEDEYYCPEHAPAKQVHGYNYKPDPEFFAEAEDNDDSLYFGIELEVDKGSDSCAVLAEDLEGIISPFYMKHDGSLSNGIEIVTHPCTLAFHEDDFDWQSITDTCRNHGFKSHDAVTCGLHIHIGRQEMGEDWATRDATAAKLVLLVNRLWDSLLTFSRREEAQVNRWACRPFRLAGVNEQTEASDAELVELAYSTRNDGRYQAVNLCNYNTVELRLFRGTLKVNTLLASIQLAQNLTRYAINHTATECNTCSFADVLAVENHAELMAYCVEKGLA